MFRAWLVLALAFSSNAQQVDFHAAFAPPHRITVGLPGGSVKTLLDAEPGALTISWTYDDLRSVPLAVWKPPRIAWRVRLQALIDDKAITESAWTRPRDGAPVLEMAFRTAEGRILLEIIGAESGAVGRVSIQNTDARRHRFALRAELIGGWVAHNPAWIDPERDGGALLAMQFERPDRVLALTVGGRVLPAGRKSTITEWDVSQGGSARGWLLRPHEAYEKDLPALRSRDWESDFSKALSSWRGILDDSKRFTVPDDALAAAFRASLADLYIMREPLAGGYVGSICGTEVYRSTNPFEPSLVAIALDQMSQHAASADGMRVHLDMQEADGNWNDPKGWAHDMWGGAGMKAWAVMEHYRLTGDRAYLQKHFPQLLASSRWQAKQRKNAGTGGLMPRGMGDGGLMNGSDHFGVFYPHNFLAVMADRLAMEAAELLGRVEEAKELKSIHEHALSDLRRSLESGAIQSDAAKWIPGSPGNPSGSRWGALYSVFPALILKPHDPLVDGTLKMIEARLSPAGQPIHTGWMEDGTWAAITLDNLAEAHLMRGEGDASAAYLYSTINHATPLVTWCEERGLEPGTKKTSGDRQHLWTPLAVVRLVRDSLVMEQGSELHLAAGTSRQWLAPGKSVGVQNAPTHFGSVTYSITAGSDTLKARVEAPRRSAPSAIVLHLRHSAKLVPRAVSINGSRAEFEARCECVRIPATLSPVEVEARY